MGNIGTLVDVSMACCLVTHACCCCFWSSVTAGVRQYCALLLDRESATARSHVLVAHLWALVHLAVCSPCTVVGICERSRAFEVRQALVSFRVVLQFTGCSPDRLFLAVRLGAAKGGAFLLQGKVQCIYPSQRADEL